MDMSWATALVTRARDNNEGAYDGALMFSALPWAPVVEARPRKARRGKARRMAQPESACAVVELRPASVN
jgi:hypothetical protein